MLYLKTMYRGIGLTAAVFLLAGCGGDSGPSYHLSGNVTFDGKPVPAGRIMFTPDTNTPTQASPGYAVIKDGKFDTNLPGGKAHSGGAMIVRIEGLEPVGEATPDPENPEGESSVQLKELFPAYTTKATLPTEDSTQDFEVPASAAKKEVKEEEA